MALIQIEIDTDDERITDLINDLVKSGLYPETPVHILEEALPLYYGRVIADALDNGIDSLQIQTFHNAVKDVKRKQEKRETFAEAARRSWNEMPEIQAYNERNAKE